MASSIQPLILSSTMMRRYAQEVREQATALEMLADLQDLIVEVSRDLSAQADWELLTPYREFIRLSVSYASDGYIWQEKIRLQMQSLQEIQREQQEALQRLREEMQ